MRCESPYDRVRASSGLNLCHPHSARYAYNSLARPMHCVHSAHGDVIHDANLHDACGVLGRNSGNSSNSGRDTEAEGHRFCVHGETKLMSTSTRSRVGRPAVEKLASPQQASRRLHVETWEGFLRNQGPKIFREVKFGSGCAVLVACPSCPDYSPEPPGPGRIIRNMLG